MAEEVEAETRAPSGSGDVASDDRARAREERKALARRLRATLATGALTLPEMAEAVGEPEEVVLKALRRLRKTRKHGRLRSGIVSGSACWWWEPRV